MNFQETLEYMYRQLPMYQRVGKVAFKKDLTNTIRLLDALQDPHRKFRSIHIAGTNGKGSSAHMLASILQTAGYRTGLYTSPHLKRFTERIKINGEEVEEQFVCDFVERIQPQIKSIKPSFFEMTVAMAFDYFAAREVDVAVVEVGLGGRFDSTNVIEPVLSLITSISYDHMDLLGNTLPEIAFEKAGIIKQDIPVVISETQHEIVDVFARKANGMRAPIFFADQEYEVRLDDFKIQVFDFIVKTKQKDYEIRSDLGGRYQMKNLPGVLKVIDLINGLGFAISEQQMLEGLKSVGKNTGLRGRWQKLSDKPAIICDTVHNEAGVRILVDQLKLMKFERLHVVWGVVEGKSPEKVLRHLPENAIYYFCQPNLPRAMRAEDLIEIAKVIGLNGKVVTDVNDAVAEARATASEKDLVIIGGSNFVVAEIEEL
jgi:dihydrofolate synthase/folylpolyglutamate synthase